MTRRALTSARDGRPHKEQTMVTGMLITIREGLEALLVTGILLGCLRKLERTSLNRYVWAGTITGVVASAGLALAFQRLALQFEGTGAAVFEAATCAAAVSILSYMVVWMQRHARRVAAEVTLRAELAISRGQVLALGALACLTVLREGVETALLLTALSTRVSGGGLMPGALLGLAAAGALAYALFASMIRLNLRRFFVVTGVLLIVIAAGLCAHLVMALHEAGLHVLDAPAWNTRAILDGESLGGRLLHVLVGYHDEPTVLQVLVYVGYLGIMGRAFRRAVDASAGPHPSPREPSVRAAAH